MKTQLIRPKRNTEMVEVETPLGVVRVLLGLRDAEGREVVAVHIVHDRLPGAPRVMLDGRAQTRMIQETAAEHAEREVDARFAANHLTPVGPSGMCRCGHFVDAHTATPAGLVCMKGDCDCNDFEKAD